MNPRSNTVQYDDFAETFGRSRRDMHWPEIDEVLAHFFQTHTTGNIADIGCGNGRLLKHVTDYLNWDTSWFTRYIWLDSSSELIDQATSDYTLKHSFNSLQWCQWDMRDMETLLSVHGPFEVIFFIASFHHLSTREDRISVLSQAKKLLSSTGEIIMINWNLTHPSQSKYQTSKIWEYPDGSADFDIKIGAHGRFYHAFSHEEYLSLAEEIWLQMTDQFGERNSILYLS